ncbi:MAG: vWA domain-containing protein [Sumerlaeia bacterium]
MAATRFVLPPFSRLLLPGLLLLPAGLEASAPPSTCADPLERIELLSLMPDMTQMFPVILAEVTVKTFHGATCQLGLNDFALVEDGVEQQVDSVICHSEGSPFADVVFLFDDSASMLDELAQLQAAMMSITATISGFYPQTRYGLMTYADGFLVVSEMTDDQQAFTDAVSTIVPEGADEPAFDGLISARNSFRFREASARLFVLITDELSNGDEAGRDVAAETIRAFGGKVIAVSPAFDGLFPSQAARDVRPLATATGGVWTNIEQTDLRALADVILSEINARYEIRYTTTNRMAMGELRHVCITALDPQAGPLPVFGNYHAPGMGGTDFSIAEPALTWEAKQTTPALKVDGSPARFDFTNHAEGWTFAAPEAFTAPEPQSRPGAIGMKARDNTKTFGFWESPMLHVLTYLGDLRRGEVPLSGSLAKENLYRARFKVMNPGGNFSTAPTIRLRTSTADFQRSDMLISTSVHNAGFSPTRSGMLYDHFFTQPEGSPRIRLDFDMLNADPSDDPNATLELDSVEVVGVPLESLSGARLEGEWDFTEGQLHRWSLAGTQAFAQPAGTRGIEGLTLRGRDVSGEGGVLFGWWGSTLGGDAVTLEANRLYRVRFTVGSTARPGEVWTVPTFRLRLNDSSYMSSLCVNIESVDFDSNIPTAGNPVIYDAWFHAPWELTGQKLIFSLDVLHATGDGNDPNHVLALRGLQVVSYDKP